MPRIPGFDIGVGYGPIAHFWPGAGARVFLPTICAIKVPGENVKGTGASYTAGNPDDPFHNL